MRRKTLGGPKMGKARCYYGGAMDVGAGRGLVCGSDGRKRGSTRKEICQAGVLWVFSENQSMPNLEILERK